jgi:hypothetical protein
MATQRLVIPGIVKNGLVVPQNDTPLPEGAHVDILIGAADVTPALQSEYAQWEQASDEAWAMIGSVAIFMRGHFLRYDLSLGCRVNTEGERRWPSVSKVRIFPKR